MLDRDNFRRDSDSIIAWIDSYLREINQYPVKSQVSPGSIKDQLPKKMPEIGCDISSIMRDFENIILPGMTHWQHPNFHAYFNANSSTESILAELLTSALGAQCMIWETSPAAAELEERVINWIRDAMHIPSNWEGVIHDTASTATLSAILSARERATDFQTNFTGIGNRTFRVYCTSETHSSLDKAVAITGIGRDNIIRVDVDSSYRMKAGALRDALQRDKNAGHIPCIVVLTLGSQE